MAARPASLATLVISTLLLTLPMLSRAEESGLLWRVVAPSGTVSYLFGAMHTDDTRANDFSPRLIEALRDSDTFMPEVLPDQRPAPPTPQEKLSDLLSEAEFDQVMQLADQHVMDRAMVNQMKPWLVAIAFDQPKPSSLFSQDIQLRGMAQDMGKRLLALEPADRHFQVLDSLSSEDQLAMLRSVLQRTQEEKERDFERLLTAYLAEDLTRIAGLDEASTEGLLPPALWEKIRVKLLDERNLRLAERIAEYCASHRAFIAVGASHLPGVGGLLQRLRAAGFTVTPIKQGAFS